MKAIKIRMQRHKFYSDDCKDIKEIYITGLLEGWFTINFLYDWLKHKPESIQVDFAPYPYVVPVKTNHIKFVTTNEKNISICSLLKLPRDY